MVRFFLKPLSVRQMRLLCASLLVGFALCGALQGLCSFAQGGYALPAENDLVCGQYILRFRLVDWAHRLTARRQTVLLAG